MLGEYWMLEFFLLYMRDFGIPVIVIFYGVLFMCSVRGELLAVETQYFDTELVDRETGERYDVAFDSNRLKQFYVRETTYYRG